MIFFRIQSVSHKVSGNIHTMTCTLDFLKENTNKTYAESEVVQREDVLSSGSSISNTDFEKLNNVLNLQVGKPYVSGAEGPNSFDCSGLVCFAFNQSGVKKVSRLTAQGYYDMCTKISVENRQPGDLISWANGSKVYHVGVYVGDGMMINAENENVGVRKTKVWSNVYSYGRL